MTTTAGAILRHRALIHPDLEALIGGSKRIHYREFNQMVNQLANYLLQCNVNKGDRVAVLCKTNYHYPLVFFAAAKVGAIMIGLDWRLAPGELDQVVQESQPKVIFYDEEFKSGLSFSDQWHFVKEMVLVSVGFDTHPTFNALLFSQSDAEPEIEVDPESPAVIIFTSGTTGKPKGVVLTHNNLYASSVAGSAMVESRFGDRYLLATPLFHVSGLMWIFSSALWACSMVFMPHFDTSKIWEVVEKERITSMMSVPPLLVFLLPELLQGNRDLSSLRGIVCGGSTVPEKLIKQYDSLGYQIIQGYGVTEFTGAISGWQLYMGLDKCRSVGKPTFFADVKIIDPETGQTLPPGEMGEIVCKGPQQFKEYWNNPEATAKALIDGWFRTGDAGYIDEDGFIYVVDRFKDVINCGGEKIYPTQVEEVIGQLDDVIEAALIGVSDPVWGEIPRAYVVKKPDSSLTEQDILFHCQQHLAHHKLAQVVFIAELPKNSLGKVIKKTLKDLAEQEQ